MFFPSSVIVVKKIIALALVQMVLQYFFFLWGLTQFLGIKSSIILVTNVFASLLVVAILF